MQLSQQQELCQKMQEKTHAFLEVSFLNDNVGSREALSLA
jgi:hypothetical protein